MFLYWCRFVCFNVFIAYVWAIPLSSEVCLTCNETVRKVQHLGDTGTAGAACRAHQAIFNSTLSQLPSSCYGASKGLSHSLNWRYAKKNRQWESPGRSLCSGESLLIICGRGLLVTSILVAWLLDHGCGGFEQRQLGWHDGINTDMCHGGRYAVLQNDWTDLPDSIRGSPCNSWNAALF